MELRQIRAFVVLADTLSFSQSADRLCITQPALSKQIAALEYDLGGALFIRNRRGAELTPLGKELYPQAKSLILQADQLRNHARKVLQGESGKLAIGIGISSLQLASALAAQFQLQNPSVTISIHDVSSAYMIPQLIEDEIQIGFLRLPVEPPLVAHQLQTDRLVLAVNQTYFPGKEEHDYLGQMAHIPFLRLNPQQGIRLNRQIDQFLMFHNIYPDKTQYASDSQTQLALVAAGIGVALVPKSAVSIAPSSVSIIDLSGKYTEWDIGIAWNPRYDNPIRDAFIQLTLSELLPASSRS